MVLRASLLNLKIFVFQLRMFSCSILLIISSLLLLEHLWIWYWTYWVDPLTPKIPLIFSYIYLYIYINTFSFYAPGDILKFTFQSFFCTLKISTTMSSDFWILRALAYSLMVCLFIEYNYRFYRFCFACAFSSLLYPEFLGGGGLFSAWFFFHIHCKYLLTFNTKAIEPALGVLWSKLGLLSSFWKGQVGSRLLGWGTYT